MLTMKMVAMKMTKPKEKRRNGAEGGDDCLVKEEKE